MRRIFAAITAAMFALAFAACEQFTPPTHTHVWSEWIVTILATCTTNGEKAIMCSTCGAVQTDVILAGGQNWGHNYSNYTVIIAPSCTTEGSETAPCARDETHPVSTRSINALGHNYMWTVMIAPTCTEAGTQTGTCTRDAATTTRYTSPIGHNYSDSTTTATETEDGIEEWICKNDPSHRAVYPAYATGTQGLSFRPIDNTAYYVNNSRGVSGGAVHIPTMHRPYAGSPYLPVTEIGGGAFTGISITSITIPDSVMSIGGSAFQNCTSLTGITIPASVTFIGDRAFQGCTSITEITIPDSVMSIGEYAFSNTSITSITIPASVTSIGSAVFLDCTNLTSITISAGVTSISNGAFSYCTSITSITIPDSVTSIGDWAFGNCTGLTSIEIPASVTSIGNVAFGYCTGLTSITIPNSVISIGSNAFYNCKSLTEITIPASVMSIGGSAFNGCDSLTGITVDVGNPHYASEGGILYNRAKTTLIQAPARISGNITIPAGVTSIDEWAFSGCTSLTGITIPDSVTSIGWAAFQDCTSLTSITVDVGNPHYTSEGGILYNKAKTQIVAVPQGINGIITIPYGVMEFGQEAFADCTNLTGITIPNSVRFIGSGAFFNCTGLTEITIPDSVTVIAPYAFYGCTNLTGIITIPASVTSIGWAAFSGTALQTIYVKGHASEAAANAAWYEGWRFECNAVIKYWNGSEYQ